MSDTQNIIIEKKEDKKDSISETPKAGHQVMLAAQSLFFRKLILDFKATQNK
jgi:hypothetical protein